MNVNIQDMAPLPAFQVRVKKFGLNVCAGARYAPKGYKTGPPIKAGHLFQKGGHGNGRKRFDDSQELALHRLANIQEK